MNYGAFLLGGGFSLAGIYLFVSAPAPLPEASSIEEQVPIAVALSILDAENAAARKLYTEQIVSTSTISGLRFDERWKEDQVRALPFPALFLRETAQALERESLGVGLFLGSDAPIAASNMFRGAQAEVFAGLRRTRQAQTFYAADIQRHTAMFPDVAVVRACADCHNKHQDSPKKDWKLGDVMGATTWTHPKSALSRSEILELVAAYRRSVEATWERLLAEAATFDDVPQVGDRWPREGNYLPSTPVFMRELNRRAATTTLDQLLSTK